MKFGLWAILLTGNMIAQVTPTPSNAQLADSIENLWQTAQTITAIDQYERPVRVNSQNALTALVNRTGDISNFVRKSKIEATRSHLNRYIAQHAQIATTLRNRLRACTNDLNSIQTHVRSYERELQNRKSALKEVTLKNAAHANSQTATVVAALEGRGTPLFDTFDRHVGELAEIVAQLATTQADSLQLYWQAISSAKTPTRANDPIVVNAQQRLYSELSQLQNTVPTHRADFQRLARRLQPQKNAIIIRHNVQQKIAAANRALEALESVIYICTVSGACPIAQSRNIPVQDVLDDLRHYLEQTIAQNFANVVTNGRALMGARLSSPPPYKDAPKDLARVRLLCQQMNQRLNGIIIAIQRFAHAIATTKLDTPWLKKLTTEFVATHRVLTQADSWTKSEAYAHLLRSLYDIAMPLNLPYRGHYFNLSDMQALSQAIKEAVLQARDVFEKDLAPLLLRAPTQR